jgi:hypothetical protein
MGHFAKVKKPDNIVLEVIKAEQDYIDTLSNTYPIVYIQTSYNTRGNVHYLPNSATPSGNPPLRGNYAGDHYIYDEVNDVFYGQRPLDIDGIPCESWTLDTTTWTWKCPVAHPDRGTGFYRWSETLQAWI